MLDLPQSIHSTTAANALQPSIDARKRGGANAAGQTEGDEQWLYVAARRLVHRELRVGAICYCVQSLCTISSPFIIWRMLKWMESADDVTAATEPVWVGCLLLGALCATTATFAFVNQWFTWTCDQAGLRVRAAFCAAAYRKVLTLSLGDMHGSSIGELTALIQTDSACLLPLWHAHIGIKVLPVEILLLVAELFFVVGPVPTLGAISLIRWVWVRCGCGAAG